MIFAIIAAWMGYKRAKESGRNGILWAFITAGAFIGTQLAVSFAAGMFIVTGIGFWGWSENTFETYTLLITAIAIVASVGVTMLILRYLGKIPEDNSFIQPPPPPSKFN